MKKNLEERIARLEQRAEDDKTFVPALVYCSSSQTLEEAMNEYREIHGFDLPENGQIFEFVACDMSREGGGREQCNPITPTQQVMSRELGKEI